MRLSRPPGRERTSSWAMRWGLLRVINIRSLLAARRSGEDRICTKPRWLNEHRRKFSILAPTRPVPTKRTGDGWMDGRNIAE